MKILVTGAASGLGKAIVNAFPHETVYRYDIALHPDMNVARCDDRDLERFFGKDFGCDVLINCAGINTNEWFESVTHDSFQIVMDVNAWGIVNMTQVALPYLKDSEVKCVINIVSNASHIPMTSSLAYNASKAAALMVSLQMAHELTPKYDIVVFSVSPNRLAGTGMSEQIDAEVIKTRGWQPEYAASYLHRSLMRGRETDPAAVAEFIADIVLTGQYNFMSGTDIPFGK